MDADRIRELRGLAGGWKARAVRITENAETMLRDDACSADGKASGIAECADQLDPLLTALLDEVEALRRSLQLTVGAAKWWAENQDSPKSALSHFELAAEHARQALANPKDAER